MAIAPAGLEPATPGFQGMYSNLAVGRYQRPPNEGLVRTSSSFKGCSLNPQLGSQRRRWESNPLQTALQAVAVPSGSSVVAPSMTTHHKILDTNSKGGFGHGIPDDPQRLTGKPMRGRIG